jgi:hypothetical protein
MIFKLLLVKEGYLVLVYAHVLDKPISTWIRFFFPTFGNMVIHFIAKEN